MINLAEYGNTDEIRRILSAMLLKKESMEDRSLRSDWYTKNFNEKLVLENLERYIENSI